MSIKYDWCRIEPKWVKTFHTDTKCYITKPPVCLLSDDGEKVLIPAAIYGTLSVVHFRVEECSGLWRLWFGSHCIMALCWLSIGREAEGYSGWLLNNFVRFFTLELHHKDIPTVSQEEFRIDSLLQRQVGEKTEQNRPEGSLFYYRRTLELFDSLYP